MAKGFGTRLRALRQSKHLGLRALAAILGVSYTYLSHIENGRRVPKPALVEKLARELGADSEELLLLAGRFPQDVKVILRRYPSESVSVLRSAFPQKPGARALRQVR